MCLVLFAFKKHKEYKLICTINRDEFYNRPTAPLNWWKENPNILAGKDLKRGGTWFGINKAGRFAVVTNYREFPHTEHHKTSRGALVTDYLLDNVDAKSYLKILRADSKKYHGYNLIFGNGEDIHHYSNKGMESTILKAGIYGLSNHLLNTPWPKVVMGTQMLTKTIDQTEVVADDLIEIMKDETIAPDEQLPDTGIGLQWEKVLSPMFIKTEIYGTRSTTVLLIDNNNRVTVKEVSYIPEEMNEYQFEINLPSV